MMCLRPVVRGNFIVESFVSLEILHVVDKDICRMLRDTQLLVWGILSMII
jgi:hypothetical protein